MKLKELSWIAAALALVVPFTTASAQETATLVGSDTCIQCHSEQAASFNGSMHGKKLPIVKGMAADKTCETCHGAGSLHAAAAGDKTNPGFATIKNPAKLDPQATAKICFTCHKNKEVMLWGTSTHSRNGLTCTKCHSVHNGQGLNNLKLSANDTCLQCHKNQKADSHLPSHHPVAEGKMNCVDCHNPHVGPNGNLRGETVNETCYKCHAEKAGPYAFEHPPVAENCTICHKPHGSVNEYLLKQPMPMLCLRCHKLEHTNIGTNGGSTVYGESAATLSKYYRCTDCHWQIHGSDRSPGMGH